jgi:hypothetical protein
MELFNCQANLWKGDMATVHQYPVVGKARLIERLTALGDERSWNAYFLK